MYLQALGIWFILALVAIINGILRNFTYQNFLPELLAHQISTFTGIFFAGIVMFVWLKKKILSNNQLLKIGLFWLAFTIAFEFLFGYFIVGHSWSKLLQDYNILEGRIWLLFLLFTLFGPYMIKNLFKYNKGP